MTDPVLLKLDTLILIEVDSSRCSVKRATGIITTFPAVFSDAQLEADRSRRSHPIFAAEVSMSEVSREASEIGSTTNVFEYSGNVAKSGSKLEEMDRKATRYPFRVKPFTTTRRPMSFARYGSNMTPPRLPSSLLEVGIVLFISWQIETLLRVDPSARIQTAKRETVSMGRRRRIGRTQHTFGRSLCV